MKNYRTEKIRLYPDKEQKVAICNKFDQADDAFDELSKLANMLVEGGNSSDLIESALDNCTLATALDNVEIQAVRSSVKKLIPRLVSGEIHSIFPRNRYRNVKTLEVMASPEQTKYISINNVGEVFIASYRSLPQDAYVFRTYLKSDCCGERFYLEYCYYYESADVAPHPINPDFVLGIDYKQDGLYVDSDGNSGGYPGFRQIGRDKLIRYNKNVKRFKKGSHRWIKHKGRLLKFMRHIENQRSDWQYKKADELANNCDAVCQETLDFRSMIRANPKLATKIYDNDLPSFSRKLTQKMKQYGKSVVHIPQYFPSSQICSYCGSVFGSRSLDDKYFNCPFCGETIDRDVNAARNIKEEGLRLMLAA